MISTAHGLTPQGDKATFADMARPPTRPPTKAEISAVMSALGKRNKGKPKAMTPAERRQRRKAGKASALARGFFPTPPPRRAHPPARSPAVLAQSKDSKKGSPDKIQDAIERTPNLVNTAFYKPIKSCQADL